MLFLMTHTPPAIHTTAETNGGKAMRVTTTTTTATTIRSIYGVRWWVIKMNSNGTIELDLKVLIKKPSSCHGGENSI